MLCVSMIREGNIHAAIEAGERAVRLYEDFESIKARSFERLVSLESVARRSLPYLRPEDLTVLDVGCAAYASAGAGGTEVPLPFSGRRDRTPLELWRGR